VRVLAIAALLGGCGDNIAGELTPEQAATQKDGTSVTVVGTVHTVTWDSTQTTMRLRELRAHADDIDWILEQGNEDERGRHFAYDDAGAHYPRTPDHYILVRSTVPDGITNGQSGFTPGKLAEAWGLGIHLTDIDPTTPMPNVDATIRVTGTVHHITWNSREITLPVVEPTSIEVLSGLVPELGPGATCSLDQQCNERTICDRATHTCQPPPREIYWADPWHDVNGACDTDADCPLGQLCDTSHAIAAAGTTFGATYFPTTDPGRHLCRLVADSTVASQCPHIYTTRDLAGARFVTGKEVCVRATILTTMAATDGDTHNQTFVDEPIPYPTDDLQYNLYGSATENGPPYKDPTQSMGALPDPVAHQDVIAIGTYRYDPDHGWYEMHPVKAYLAPP
jgi:hypothetical protein